MKCVMNENMKTKGKGHKYVVVAAWFLQNRRKMCERFFDFDFSKIRKGKLKSMAVYNPNSLYFIFQPLTPW